MQNCVYSLALMASLRVRLTLRFALNRFDLYLGRDGAKLCGSGQVIAVVRQPQTTTCEVAQVGFIFLLFSAPPKKCYFPPGDQFF